MPSYSAGKYPPGHKSGKESFTNTLPLLVAGGLGIWMGMVVWNVAENMPAGQMGLIALSVYSLHTGDADPSGRGAPPLIPDAESRRYTGEPLVEPPTQQ